jgi:Flp pilus assembly protein TadB
MDNPTKNHLKAETQLAHEITKLTQAIEKIEKMQPFAALRNRKKFFAYSFLHGLLVGFGSVLGASLLVALFIFLLRQIEFAPLVGSFVQDILKNIQPK